MLRTIELIPGDVGKKEERLANIARGIVGESRLLDTILSGAFLPHFACVRSAYALYWQNCLPPFHVFATNGTKAFYQGLLSAAVAQYHHARYIHDVFGGLVHCYWTYSAAWVVVCLSSCVKHVLVIILAVCER